MLPITSFFHPEKENNYPIKKQTQTNNMASCQPPDPLEEASGQKEKAVASVPQKVATHTPGALKPPPPCTLIPVGLEKRQQMA